MSRSWQGNAQVQQWLAADLAQVEARVLLAMPGVGLRVAAAVLAYLPVGVWGQAKAAAACAGVHSRQVQSGRSSHSRMSKTPSHQLRRSMYMAALVAIRHDADLRAYDERLLGRGKAKLVAIVAVMHKLLRQMMGRLKAFYRSQGVLAVA